jgi:biotin-(acetyl-CoA carboxylase) ligase
VSAKSVLNAIEEYFLEFGILTKSLTLKWVNDIYLNEKKVAGVLVQT